MTERIAVLVPARNVRHLLWRSLACLAAQSLPPAQVLILDEGSTDGLADWLRLRWPGVELASAAGSPRRALDAALAGITAPVVAFMEPGDRWPSGHLAALATAWAEAGSEIVAVPAAGLERAGDGALRMRTTAGEIPLAALGVATDRLRATHTARDAASVAEEIRARCHGLTPRPAAGAGTVLALDRADPAAAEVADLAGWVGLLERAAAGLPAGAGALLIDLQAASRPAGLLNLLGMAVAIGAGGRALQAMTLADLAWQTLEATPEGIPVVVTTPTPLDLRHATDQLCIEEIVRRSGRRPVRLAVRSLLPSSPMLLSRLIETVLGHPDLELWLNDAVGYRYAVSLLGPKRVRLTPPPLTVLGNGLRQVTELQLLLPAMLRSGEEPGPGLPARLADPGRWSEGCDVDAARRLGPALARVLGLGRLLEVALLQEAWASTLTGWAAARSEPGPVRTTNLDAALFAGLCGCRAVLEPDGGKVLDFATSWARVLPALGVAVAEAVRPRAA
jgi:hypothetical protein